MTVIDVFTVRKVSIRLIHGDIRHMEGDTLLLPANRIVSNVEGISSQIVHSARDSIMPQLEKYRFIELEIGTVIVTCAGPLKFQSVSHVVIPNYRLKINNDPLPSLMKLSFAIGKAIDSADTQKAEVVVSPILGDDKGYSPALAAEAVMEGVLMCFDKPYKRLNIKEINIVSSNLASLILMALTLEKRIYPYGKKTDSSGIFRIRKCRILEPAANNAVIVIVSRYTFNGIVKSSNNAGDSNEYKVIDLSENSIHLIDIDPMKSGEVKEVVYIAAPNQRTVAHYEGFIQILCKQLEKVFNRENTDISVVLDFDGAVQPFKGREIFSGEDFQQCFLEAVKRVSDSVGGGET